MKMPIPDDWDGETFVSYAICWPASDRWRWILRGFITTPQRGRFWDEKTGSILNQQAIGRQIADLNSPMEECAMTCTDVAALTGQLTRIADVLDGSFDSDRSATEQLGGIRTQNVAIQNRLAEIRNILDGTTPESTLDDIEGALAGIAEILGIIVAL